MLEIVVVRLALVEARVLALIQQVEVREDLAEILRRIPLVEILVDVADGFGDVARARRIDAVGDVELVTPLAHEGPWAPKKPCTIEI